MDVGRRQRLLRWGGLLCCVLAVAAVVVPIVAYARALGGAGVHLGGDPQELTVRPEKAYGIYIDDADNSGYSESCSVEDGKGRPISLEDPPWSIGSQTESLDHVFRSPTPVVTLDCSIQGATGSVRPLPSIGSLLVGLGASAILGWLGVFMLVASSRRDRAIAFTSHTSARRDGGQAASSSSASTPPAEPDRDVVPAVVATAVGLPLLGLQVLGWIAMVVVAPSAFDDPDLWNGVPPAHGPSMWDVARSTWWPDLLPVGVGAVLILATWLLAVRRRTTAAWATCVVACAAAIVSLFV